MWYQVESTRVYFAVVFRYDVLQVLFVIVRGTIVNRTK